MARLGQIVSLILILGIGYLIINAAKSHETLNAIRRMATLKPSGRQKTNIPGFRAKHVRKDCVTEDLDNAAYHSQYHEDRALLEHYFLSPKICDGVYVELGALDGIRFSNTKFFEEYMNWTGLLIEAAPSNAGQLQKNRNTSHNTIIPEAVCAEGQKYVNFTGGGAMAHVYHGPDVEKRGPVHVPCRPISTMLQEAGITAIDLFSLDVEGAEMMVLDTMDWSIPVKAWVIEMGHGRNDTLLVLDVLYRHGYRKADWDIRTYHRRPESNQVFEHHNYTYQ